MSTVTLLDCGHEPTEARGCGTGWATLSTGQRVCYPCADDHQRAELPTLAAFTAYLSSDCREVTTWTGGTLARVTRSWEAPAGWSTATYVQAVAPDGSRWHGRGQGGGMYLRLRRCSTT